MLCIMLVLHCVRHKRVGHTLEELLACVLLEERLMSDRSCKIVNHELEDWLDLLFGVASIVSQSRVL